MADNDKPNQLPGQEPIEDDDQEQVRLPKRPNRHIPDDPGFEVIKGIGRKYATRTAIDAQERLRLEQASERIQGLEELISDRPELARSKPISEGLKEAREIVKKLSPKVALRRETTRERAVKETMANIGREFSDRSIESQIRKGTESSTAQGVALGLTGKSQRELEKERSSILSQISELEEKAGHTVQNELYDKEGRQNEQALDTLKSAYRQKRALAGKAASIDAALQKKRQEGTDDKSVDRSLFAIGAKAQDTLFRNRVGEELRSQEGVGAMSTAQLKEQEVEQAKALTDALEKLKNSAGETAENIDKLREEAKDAAEGLQKTQEALKQRQQAGGGDESTLGRRLMSMVPGLMNTAAAAAQESLINQPMSTMQTRTGFAALSNQMYANRNAAIGGDMTALLNATKDVGKTMSSVGENFKENADIVRGLNLGAGAVTTGLGIAQVTKGAAQQFNPLSTAVGGSGIGEITGGVKTTIEGLAQVTTAGTDIINQTSRQAANLGGQQSIYALNQEVNRVRGDFRQSFFDYSMGTRGAALAIGGRGGREMINQFTEDQGGPGGMLDRLQQARIAPQEFTRLAAEAGLEQGSVFNTDQVFRSRQLERSGVGTTEMNLQRMTTLAAAGSNNPQTGFSSVLEAAFSKSLDSSKAINMMVQNTAEMVRTSAGATMLGIDTTRSSAERLAALTDPNMQNREVALTRAMTAEQRLNEINTGIGTNFSDMLTTTRMAREGGVNSVTAMNLKKLDNQTADALQAQLTDYQRMAPGAERDKLREQLEGSLFKAGAGGFVGPNGEIRAEEASKALRIRGMSALAGGNFLNLVDPNTAGYDQFQSGEITGEQIKKDPQYRRLREQISTAAATAGLTEDEIYAQVMRATGKSPITEAGKAQARQAESGTAGSQALRDMDEAGTASGADMANKARLAAKELGGAAEALSKINKQIQSLVTNLTDKTSGGFQNAAADAATNFQNSANTFNSAAVTFRDSVNVFARIPTSTGEAVRGAIQPLIDKVNTIVPGSGDNRTKTGPRG